MKDTYRVVNTAIWLVKDRYSRRKELPVNLAELLAEASILTSRTGASLTHSLFMVKLLKKASETCNDLRFFYFTKKEFSPEAALSHLYRLKRACR